MKIGDLVRWHAEESPRPFARRDTGIIVDGPRDGCSGDSPAISYAVAWFDAKATFWHLDFNLEIINENR